jgi:hypothetical protein
MNERELEYKEAIQRLAELFSDDSSAPPSRGRRKYFLEYQDGEPVFRLAEMPSKSTIPRDENESAMIAMTVKVRSNCINRPTSRRVKPLRVQAASKL